MSLGGRDWQLCTATPQALWNSVRRRRRVVTRAPLAIDLFCGLGGWTDGLLAEGYRVIGFDNERHVYGEARYPSSLVLQDVRTIHGAQFKDATLIVASPPCQTFSYMAMPWSRAKQQMREYLAGTRDVRQLTALFDACFRIQREACEAAGRHIPLVVENVCGAQKWVGRARWHYGSFYLWGDVPALMPIVRKCAKVAGFRFDGSGGSFQTASVAASGVKVPTMGAGWYPPDHPKHVPGLAFNGHAERALRARNNDGERNDTHRRRSSTDVEERSSRSTETTIERQSESVAHCGGTHRPLSEFASAVPRGNGAEIMESIKTTKNDGGSWFNVAHNTTSGHGQNPVNGVKGSEGYERNHPEAFGWKKPNTSSHSSARKTASAHIAKIPFTLACHIAHAYHPHRALDVPRSTAPCPP